jgi:hypothetical protein
MNNVLNYRGWLLSLVTALLCIALLVGIFLMHESASAAHLVRHGIMIIQVHRQIA